MLELKIAKLLLITLKQNGELIHSKMFFFWGKKKVLEQKGVNNDDSQLFCMLHRILSQSINIFNYKMLIEDKQLEIACNRKNYGNEQRKKEVPVWTLSKFIEARTEFCTNKRSSSKDIALYTEFYSCINSIVVSSLSIKL
jgi:hypothetical protein